MTIPQRTQLLIVEHDTGGGAVTFTYTVPDQATATVINASYGTSNGFVAAASPAGIPLFSIVSPASAAGFGGVLYTSLTGSVENIQLPTTQPTTVTTTTWSGPQILGPGCTLTLAGPNTKAVIIESKLIG